MKPYIWMCCLRTLSQFIRLLRNPDSVTSRKKTAFFLNTTLMLVTCRFLYFVKVCSGNDQICTQSRVAVTWRLCHCIYSFISLLYHGGPSAYSIALRVIPHKDTLLIPAWTRGKRLSAHRGPPYTGPWSIKVKLNLTAVNVMAIYMLSIGKNKKTSNVLLKFPVPPPPLGLICGSTSIFLFVLCLFLLNTSAFCILSPLLPSCC